MNWIAGWGKRIKFTVDSSKVDEVLTNFPILVNLDTTYSGVFNELGNNYKKISFMNPTTGEEYYCEVEIWDNVNNRAQLWVKIPNVSSSKDTEFYMLYDGTHIDNSNYIGEISSAAAQKVWDDNFVAVYHLSQDPSTGGACILDSTSGANNGTPNGNMTSSDLVNVGVGKGLLFDGTDDHIDLNSVVNIGTNHSISFISHITNTATEQVVSNQSSPSNGRLGIENDRLQIHFSNDTGYHTSLEYTNTNATSIFTLTRHNNTCNLYVDSNLADTTTDLTITDNIQINCIGGKHYSTTWDYFSNTLRNIVIYNTVLSENYIKTTYYSNTDQLLIKGAEETVISGTLNYENKIKIVIPNYSYINTLYNFPVLLNISSAAGKNNADVRDVFYKLEHYLNRKKIAITDHTGIAQLYCEIERWDQVEQSAQLWVKVPEISNATETILYIYYDKNKDDNYLMVGDTGSLPAMRVWGDNYTGVWHLSQNPSTSGACILDSTSNENHGTPHGGMTSSDLVDAVVGKGLAFDGSDDYIDIPNKNYYNDDYTVEVIVKPISDSPPTSRLVRFGARWILSWRQEAHIQMRLKNDSTIKILEDPADPSTYVGQYLYISADARSNTTNYLYLNTELKDSDNPGSLISETSTNLSIGGAVNSEFNNSVFKEVRFRKTGNTTSIVKATYYSNFDNFVIYDLTPEETWLETYENGSLSPWAKRIKLEIDNTNIDEPLVDFPVLVNITEDSGINNADLSDLFDELSNNSLKIAITNSHNKQLYTEIERWDYTENNAQLWTKVPFVMPHEKTILYLYYDKNKSDNTDYVGYTGSAVGASVWDDYFVGVWHLSQDPGTGGACIKDSTYHGSNGTPNGGMSTSNITDCVAGKCLKFDGSNDYISIPDASHLKIINNSTVELMDKPNSYSQRHNPLYKSYGAEFAITEETNKTTDAFFGTAGDDSSPYENAPIPGTSNYNWNFIAQSRNFDTKIITTTRNNQYKEKSTTFSELTASTNDVWIGNGYTTYFNGYIREVRLSKTNRSKTWLFATYYSNFDNLIYYGPTITYNDYIESLKRYTFTGVVTVNDSPVSKTVYFYRESTNELVGSVISDTSTGEYEFKTPYNEKHILICMDDNFSPLVKTGVLPIL